MPADAGHFCVYLDHVIPLFRYSPLFPLFPLFPLLCFSKFVLLQAYGCFSSTTVPVVSSGTDSSISILDWPCSIGGLFCFSGFFYCCFFLCFFYRKGFFTSTKSTVRELIFFFQKLSIRFLVFQFLRSCCSNWTDSSWSFRLLSDECHQCSSLSFKSKITMISVPRALLISSRMFRSWWCNLRNLFWGSALSFLNR